MLSANTTDSFGRFLSAQPLLLLDCESGAKDPVVLSCSWVSRWLALLGVVAGLLSLVPVAIGDELVPQAHQLDVAIANLSSFVADASLVRVREHQIAGTRLHLAQDLGIQTIQLPHVSLTYWFDEINALQVNLRYFESSGSHGLSQSVDFNGATLAPGQRLKSGDTMWFDGAMYYERRLTPWLQHYLGEGSLVKGLDLRAKVGLEFTYLDFRTIKHKARGAQSPQTESSIKIYRRIR